MSSINTRKARDCIMLLDKYTIANFQIDKYFKYTHTKQTWTLKNIILQMNTKANL